MILSTHDMHTAEQMCDHIFMIFKAKKVLDGSLRSIQDAYGGDAIRLRGCVDPAPLSGIEGVAAVNDFGQSTELTMTGNREVRAILADVVARVPVDALEVARPSLHDIFVRIARPTAEELS